MLSASCVYSLDQTPLFRRDLSVLHVGRGLAGLPSVLRCAVLCCAVPCCAGLHEMVMSMQVYKAKMGVLDVAVKTINRQHINPELNIAHALRVMQKVRCILFMTRGKELSMHQMSR